MGGEDRLNHLRLLFDEGDDGLPVVFWDVLSLVLDHHPLVLLILIIQL